MRDKLITKDRVKAIQEELAGFIIDQVLPKTGEYFPFRKDRKKEL